MGWIWCVLTLAVAIALLGPNAVSARRATCEDITAARARGLTVEQIKNDLATTRARISACAKRSEVRARQDARRAQRAERRQQRRAR